MNKQIFLKINILIFSLLSIIAFFLEQLKSLPYILLGICILYLVLLSIEEMKKSMITLSEDRKIWLKDVIDKSFPRKQKKFNEFYSLKIVKLDQFEAHYHNELGLAFENNQTIRTSPDFQSAEIEMIKAEDRISILLGMTVFIPVLFALLHIFRFVGLSIFLLEIQIAFLVAWVILIKQDQKYNIEYWEVFFEQFEKNRFLIEKLGKKSINFIPNIVDDPKKFELSMDPILLNRFPSQEAFAFIFSSITNLPISVRGDIFDKIFIELEDLPKKENILNNRKEAYTSRTKMITIASTAVSAMLAGVAQYTVPLLNSDLFPVKSTPFLSWGQFFVVVGINSIILFHWMDFRRLGIWISIYSIIYFFFFFLNTMILL